MDLKGCLIVVTYLLGSCASSVDDADSDLLDTSQTVDTEIDDTVIFQPPIFHGFFAVHLEPGKPAVANGGPNPERGALYFADLVRLVEESEVLGHRLTVMFTAQWARHISSRSCELPDDGDGELYSYLYNGAPVTTCLALVWAWEGNGHEVAIHHHPITAGNWDGFSNDQTTVDEDDYLGTMNDFMGYLSQLSGTIQSGTSEEFPLGGGAFRYSSARGYTPYVGVEDGGDLVSRPCSWHEDNHDVWRSRMRLYTSASAQAAAYGELEKVLTDYSDVEAEVTLGFITHAVNVNETGLDGYRLVFEKLSNAGIQLASLAEVTERYTYTSVAAGAAALEHRCGADEAGD